MRLIFIHIALVLISMAVLVPATSISHATLIEICDNGIDDDNDGFIDLNDSDCTCEIIQPISHIPNPSFEDLECCPSGRSQLNCAKDWIQASGPTTDLIHTCGWLGWDDFPPPMPFPDGNGIMGFRNGRYAEDEGQISGWKEYAGACLLSPLLQDTTYRFQFDIGFADPRSSPPINVTIFGSTDCDNLPFGVENIDLGCPTNGPGWIHLGAREISGGNGNRWFNTYIDVTPTSDIYAIAIGPSCALVTAQQSLYYFFDNLILADIRFFELNIESINHPCSSEFSLKVNNNNAFEYQWFKDGIALTSEKTSTLSMNYGEGSYQIQIHDGVKCRLSTEFEYKKPVINTAPIVTICSGETYPFGGIILDESGIHIDTFTSAENCDSVVSLNLRILGEIVDTVSVKIFKGEKYRIGTHVFSEKGDYNITLNSALGCDSLILLHLELFDVFAPNIFSPNKDGFNDTFTMLGASDLFYVKTLSVYDRWGSKIYEGREWDGSYHGDLVDQGVYTYKAALIFRDGNERVMVGSVAVVR